ncbi:MAG: HmuY family protein [Bacteroidetes bacterium]|nr:HmuY family protein [Bacteroidota bacterium]
MRLTALIQLAFCMAVLGLGSCEKEETPYKLPPKPHGNIRISQINLGENYEEQIYIHLLDSPSIKASFDGNSWDLSFESSPWGNRIYLNGGKGVLVANSGNKSFIRISEPEYLNYRWDEASGGDSLALKNWCDNRGISFDSIYVIDRGPGAPAATRYFQMRIKLVDATHYELEVADLKAKQISTFAIQKDPSKQLVFYSYDSPTKTLNLEPAREDWHLVFLRYRWIYYDFKPPLLYTVTGIHINQELMQVGVDSTLLFENISLKDSSKFEFSSDRDQIGFDWKNYDFQSGKYKTRNYVTYLIRLKDSGKNRYFKLRFIDFYSSSGLKGSPKFEIEELEP